MVFMVTILLYIILCIMTFYNFSYIILFIIVGFHNLFVYKGMTIHQICVKFGRSYSNHYKISEFTY